MTLGPNDPTLRPPGARDPAGHESSGTLRAVVPPLPPEAAAAPPAARFGNYVRVEKLGKGGMGEVWKAWDVPLGRWVALKFLSGGEETEIARFQQEAQVAGKLSHPNIAAVYGAGEAGGRHFIAMQYIDGETASKLPRGDRRLLARVVRDAARAVEEAHRQGVVHRDLKPDNLMVRGKRGSGSVRVSSAGDDLHVYVMDFGLARRTDVAGLSASGSVLGTPMYMPPEQARAGAVDARSDVYSLGATLYELLSGGPPFGGRSLFEVLKAVQELDPAPPRRFNPSIEPDLETIVLKCLEKDPARRYASAADLAADLDRFLAGEHVAARPPTLARRVGKRLFARRAVLLVGALGLAGVAATLALVLPPVFRQRAERARAQRALDLWVRIAGLIADAEVDSRSGEGERAAAKLDEGIRECRASFAGGELPEARYFLGKMLRARGDDDAALAELDRALELNPALGEARLERGLLLSDRYLVVLRDAWKAAQARQDFTAGEVSMATIEAANPASIALRDRVIADLSAKAGLTSWFRSTDAAYGLAMLSRARRDVADTRRRLEALLAEDPTYVAAAIQLAWILVETGEWDAAIRLGESVTAQHRGRPDAHVALAYAWYWKAATAPDDPRARDWRARALASAKAALTGGDRSAAAWSWLGTTRSATGDKKGAIEAYTEALKLRPGDALILTDRGIARRESGDLAGARADYDAAEALDPRSPGVFFNRASLRDLQGDWKGAVEDYTRALSVQPVWPDVHANRGLCRLKLGDDRGGLDDYAAALAQNPRHVITLNNRGMYWFEHGDFPKALADLDAALAIRPRYATGLQNRGMVRWKTHDNKGANEDFTRALDLDPNLHDARLHRASARVETGDADGALEDFGKVLEAGLRTAECHFGLGNAWTLKSDTKKAAEEFEKAAADDPAMTEAWFNLGFAYMRLFRFKDAVRALDRGLALEPGDGMCLATRAHAKRMLRDWKGAVEDYEAALRGLPKDWEGRAEVEEGLEVARRKMKK